MSTYTEISYLLVVEWDTSLHRPQVVVHHHLTLPAGTKQEELERFVSETVLPQLAGMSIRIGGVVRAYLLRADPMVPEKFLDLEAPLPPGVQAESKGFRVVARSSGQDE